MKYDRSLFWPGLGVLALAGTMLGVGLSSSSIDARGTVTRLEKEAPVDYGSIKSLTAYIERVRRAEQTEIDRDPRLRGKDRESATEYLESLLMYIRERALPYDRVNVRMYDTTFRPQGPGIQANLWEFLGPWNWKPAQRGYAGNKMVNGRINAIAFGYTVPGGDPYFYTGSPSGGVWKYDYAAGKYVNLSDLTWPFNSVSSIAVKPGDPSVVYVGTGDFHGARPTGGIGIMKSTDGGLTWAQKGKDQFGSSAISSIYVVPEEPNIVIASAGRGANKFTDGKVYRSENSGDTWQVSIDVGAQWSKVVGGELSRSTGRRIIYAVGMGTRRLRRSLDNGKNWEELAPPWSASANDFVDLAPSIVDPDTAYIVSGTDKTVYRTTNGGRTWAATPTQPTGFDGTDATFWGQTAYNWSVACGMRMNAGEPVDTVYVGVLDIAYSPDAGATWQNIGKSDDPANAEAHRDQQSATVSPGLPNKTYDGNDGGVISSVRAADGSFTWQEGNASPERPGAFSVTEMYHGDVSRFNEAVILGGCQDNSVPFSPGDLTKWRDALYAGDGGYSAISMRADMKDTITQAGYFDSGTGFVWQTADAFATAATYIGNNFGGSAEFIPPIAIDPVDPSFVYWGGDRLWIYAFDGGGVKKWFDSTGALGSNIKSITPSTKNSNIVYFGTMSGAVYRGVYDGPNRKVIATKINAGATALPETRPILGIDVDPNNENRIMVSLGGAAGVGRVWRCDNTTLNNTTRVWTKLDTGLPDTPMFSVAFDPDVANWYYVGGDDGFFYSRDSGATWKNGTQSAGLPKVSVRRVKVNPGSAFVYAFTYGRGIWRVKANQLP